MPDSAVLTFTDPDAFYAAVRNAQVDGVVTARGNFQAELTRIDLNRVWMLRGEESLARIHSVAIGNRVAILFPTGPRKSARTCGRTWNCRKAEFWCLAWVRSDISEPRRACDGVPCR